MQRNAKQHHPVRTWAGIATASLGLLVAAGTASADSYDSSPASERGADALGTQPSPTHTDRVEERLDPRADRDTMSDEQEPSEATRELEVDDDTLAQQVAQRLAAASFDGPGRVEASDDLMGGWEITGQGIDIQVDAENGAIQLTGTIDRLARVAELEREARTVPGVKQVTSSLEIASNDQGLLQDDEEETAE